MLLCTGPCVAAHWNESAPVGTRNDVRSLGTDACGTTTLEVRYACAVVAAAKVPSAYCVTPPYRTAAAEPLLQWVTLMTTQREDVIIRGQ